MLASILALPAACGDDGGSGDDPDAAPGQPDAAGPANGPVAVTQPADSADIEQGIIITVEWNDTDNIHDNTAELFADGDGDLLTPEFQFRIAHDLEEGDGSAQTFMWDTREVAPGTYHLVMKTSDGATAEAPGVITIGAAAAPVAELLFPTPVGLTDATAITVRGTASDATGVQSVSVAGVSATSDDGFATWVAADVPLTAGVNMLTVVTQDTLGNQSTDIPLASITQSATADQETIGGGNGAMTAPQDISFDRVNDRVLVVDNASNTLIGVALDTGNRTILSGDTVGTGTAFGDPRGVVANDTRALVADDNDDVVYNVNLETGERVVLVDGTDGQPAGFGAPASIAQDTSNDRLIILDDNADELISVALNDGSRSVLSSDAVGTGDSFNSPTRIALDVANDRAFVLNRVANGFLTAIDLTNGNRTIVASATVGAGDPDTFRFPSGLAADVANNRVFVQLSGSDVLAAVDLASGDRTPIASAAVGRGPAFSGQESLSFDAERQVMFALDDGHNAIMAIDVTTGDRMFISK